MIKDQDFITDEEIVDISSKLRFISQIGPGQQVDVGMLSVYSSNSAMMSFYRTLTGEGREKTLKFINEQIEIALVFIQKCYRLNTKKYISYAVLLTDDLAKINTGISNLIELYTSDTMFKSKLQALMETITIRIENIRKPE